MLMNPRQLHHTTRNQWRKQKIVENISFHQEIRETLLKRFKRINRPRFYYEFGWVRVQRSSVPIAHCHYARPGYAVICNF